MTEVLDELFNSRLRTRILKLFLFNPTDTFTPPQIANRIRSKKSDINGELFRLQKIGVIIVKSKKEKILALNNDFNFLIPLKNLFLKATYIPDAKLTRQIRRLGKIKLAVLGGVFADTTKTPADLLIVSDSIHRSAFKNFVKDLEADLGREIIYSVMDIEEFNYRRQMCDHFVKTMLEMPHKVLIDKLNVKE